MPRIDALRAGRSQRNLQLLRRQRARRPRGPTAPLRRCSSCHAPRRLGWGKEEGWSCEPCWQRYLERHKQWYLDASPSVRCSSCGVREEDSSGWMGDGDWHCEGCWRAWFTKQGFEEWYKWNIERWYAQRDGHLDFIEIGTSNYSTITQTCAGHHDGKKGMWNLLPEDKSLRCMRGLAVDMQQQYLRQLPQLPHVAKVCAAVSEFDGTKLMEDVPARRLKRWEAIFVRNGNRRGYRALQLARGCSALCKHRVLRKELGKVGLRHLLCRRRVAVRSLPTLLKEHGVTSVNLLALDCEGHDCAILRGLLRGCREHPPWHPKLIMFETNGMSDETFGPGTEQRMVRELEERGYAVLHGGPFAEAGYRNTIMERQW